MPGKGDPLAEVGPHIWDTAERLLLAARSRLPSPQELCDLNSMVVVALSLTRRCFRDANVRLVHRPCLRLPPVIVRRGYVEQALVNVLTNACKAVHPGQVVRVTTTHHPSVPSVAAQVEDKGEGIPSRVQRRIFQPFFSTWGGLGLGLPVARELVRRVGGRLRLESTPGRGTCVTITLPAARPLSPSPEPEETPSFLGDSFLALPGPSC